MVLVDADVVEALAVAHPDDRAVGVANEVVGVDSGREIANADNVELGARRVITPGELGMVGRRRGFVDLEKGEVTALGITVEHNLLDAVLACLAAEHRLLAALTVSRVVQPGSIGDRQRGIILFHAAAHLRDKGVDQFGGRLKVRRGIGVLRLEHGPDRRGQGVGVAQDLAPIVGAEPGVIVVDRDAMNCSLRRTRVYRGRLRDRPRRGRR